MLNLTQMFLHAPSPRNRGEVGAGIRNERFPVCARKVVSDDAIKSKPGTRTKALNEQAVLSAMKPECAYSMPQIIKASGVSKTSCRAAVARLVKTKQSSAYQDFTVRFTCLHDQRGRIGMRKVVNADSY